MENNDNFIHSATVFLVKDIQKSIAFYTKKLVFDIIAHHSLWLFRGMGSYFKTYTLTN